MKKIIPFVISFLLFSCASFREQKKYESSDSLDKKIVHTVYLTGGFAQTESDQTEFNSLAKVLKDAPNPSTLLLLGNDVAAKKGIETNLEAQVSLFKNFNGTVFCIPGDYDWKLKDYSRIQELAQKVEDKSGHSKIYATKNAPVTSVAVNENLEIIFIDSEWYLSDWDDVKYINRDSDIKTRRQFVETLESLIKAKIDKNIIIAMHHPVFSNGKHAGKYSFQDHITPFPLLGTALKTFREVGGTNPQDNNSARYRELAAEVTALAKLSNRITIVSGHESSLQLLEGNGIFQIISATLSNQEATKLSKGSIKALGGKLNYKGIYSGSKQGYSKINYYEDGSSEVEFHSFPNDDLLYRHQITKQLPLKGILKERDTVTTFPKTSVQQILTDKETSKSDLFRFWWGNHYRKYYSRPITVKTAYLDTIYGGVTILKEGGGHQSQSLRLVSKDGRQYVMRSLKKNAMKFLRFKIKGIAYNQENYDNTAAEKIVNDFFTTSHPYAQLVVKDLAEVALINHSDTKLYYFPKQSGFGDLNELYGGAMYFIEERPSKKQINFEGYQNATENKDIPIKDFYGTNEVLEKLRSSNKYTIDERQYIRSRIFDMLLGDWDRHSDQWRWAFRQTSKNEGVFSPIPRDRDAAFSKFDGAALKLIKRFVPETRFWQNYSKKIKNVKAFNSEAYNLDKIILSHNNVAIWKEEANSIQKLISDSLIDQVFEKLPSEIKDGQIEQIKTNLKKRLENIEDIANTYAKFIAKSIVIYGSEKNEVFVVERIIDGKTKITITSVAKDKEIQSYEQTFDSNETKELLIYGLNGDDKFIVKGDDKNVIRVRLIGGYGSDDYELSSAVKTNVYDYNYETSKFENKKPSKKQLSTIYETNNLHYRYFDINKNLILPAIGFATDDGLSIGFKDTYNYKGFNGNPNKQVHKLAANYYFKYQSVDASYDGTFANIVPKVDLFVKAYTSSSKFSNNFFGYGNESFNPDEVLGKDYNRARTREINLKSGLTYKHLNVALLYESIKVEHTNDRFFVPSNFDTSIFKNQNYASAEVGYEFKNRDADDFPTAGLYIDATLGWKTNLDDSDANFGYTNLKIGFDHKLVSSGLIVFQNTTSARIIFGDNFNFYHAASLGGNNGLRGFRNERFSGKSSLYNSSNLKFKIARLRTGLLPVDFGVYGGFDVGRVWFENEDSNKWHLSQGGGFWLGGLNMLSLQAGYFNSVEGNILFVGFNFKY